MWWRAGVRRAGLSRSVPLVAKRGCSLSLSFLSNRTTPAHTSHPMGTRLQNPDRPPPAAGLQGVGEEQVRDVRAWRERRTAWGAALPIFSPVEEKRKSAAPSLFWGVLAARGLLCQLCAPPNGLSTVPVRGLTLWSRTHTSFGVSAGLRPGHARGARGGRPLCSTMGPASRNATRRSTSGPLPAAARPSRAGIGSNVHRSWG